MTAEYTLDEGQEIGDLARELLAAAEELDRSPAVVAWAPRPDVRGGGVFVVTDVEVEQLVLQKRQAKAAADERAAAEAAQPAEEAGDAQDGGESAEETPPAEGAPLTTAQKRRAAKEAKAADAAAADASSEAPAEPVAEQNAE